jgi:hypothetical protein
MEQRKVYSANLKKSVRPKSFLSWIVNTTSAPATTENTNEEEANKNNTPTTNIDHNSNKLEIRDRDQYMMNNSLSTPTTIGSYTQLRSEYNNIKSVNAPEIVIDNQSCNEIKIPSRRQSHLYTQFHDSSNEYTSNNTNMINTDYYNSKRRSYYTSNLAPIDASISNSSLTRSATWQPSSSLSANNTANTANTPGNKQYITPINADSIPARRTSKNYANNPNIQAKLDAMLNSDRTFYLSNAIHQNNNSGHIDSSSSNNSSMYRRSTTPGNRIS